MPLSAYAGLVRYHTRLLPASVSAPTGLCRTRYLLGSLCLTCCLPHQSCIETALQSRVIQTSPCRHRVMHITHSSETQYIRNSPIQTGSARHQVGKFWKISKFSKKYKNFGNCPKSAQNQKNWKISNNFFLKFFF
jgi:hypothetical protein